MLFALAAFVGGLLLTYLVQEDTPVSARAAAGVPLGVAVSGLLAFPLAWALGMHAASMVLASLLTVALPLVLGRGRLLGRARRDLAGLRWPRLRRRRTRLVGAFAYLAAVASVLVPFARKALWEDAEGIHTGAIDSFADSAYHLAITMGFYQGGAYPPESPLLAGARLTYPFLIDFVAAGWMTGGLSATGAYALQNAALLLSFVGLLYRFTLLATRDRAAARLAPVLLLLGGGLGFLLVIPGAREHPEGFPGFLRALPHDFTEWGGVLWWGNPLVYWFAPMRSMTLGAPLMLLVWCLWWRALTGATASDPRRTRRLLLAAGCVTGLLPLAHAHFFAVTLAMGVLVPLAFGRLRAAVPGLAAAVLLAAPQAALLAAGSGTRPSSFLGWAPGWMAGDSGTHPAVFWLLNLGLFLPLFAYALLRPGAVPARLRRFALPFLLCFVAGNVVRMAPWAWDNVKVLAVWYIASVPLVACVLTRLARRGPAGAGGVVAVAVVLLTLSGALDVTRMLAQSSWQIYDREQIRFAAFLHRATPPRALCLTAPAHTTPAGLAGRRIVLNYPGFVWTNGLDFEEREQQVKAGYAGGPAAERLLQELGVGYIVFGPQEKDWAAEKGVTLNEGWYAARCERLPSPDGPYRAYRVPAPPPSP